MCSHLLFGATALHLVLNLDVFRDSGTCAWVADALPALPRAYRAPSLYPPSTLFFFLLFTSAACPTVPVYHRGPLEDRNEARIEQTIRRLLDANVEISVAIPDFQACGTIAFRNGPHGEILPCTHWRRRMPGCPVIAVDELAATGFGSPARCQRCHVGASGEATRVTEDLFYGYDDLAGSSPDMIGRRALPRLRTEREDSRSHA
jgi:hypothetical protein